MLPPCTHCGAVVPHMLDHLRADAACLAIRRARATCPAAPVTHLPGGATSLRIAPTDGLHRLGQLHGLRAIHGLVSHILGRPHHPHRAMWSLFPHPESPSGWGVLWLDTNDAERLASQSGTLPLWGVDRHITLGPLVRLRWPPTRVPGFYDVRVSTRTPLAIRSTVRGSDGQRTGHHVYRTDPDGESFRHALWSVVQRVQLDTLPSFDGGRFVRECSVEVVDRSVHDRTVRRGRKIPEETEGVMGTWLLRVNAPARWLLDVAARQVGLGGQTAYGLGAIEVEDVV